MSLIGSIVHRGSLDRDLSSYGRGSRFGACTKKRYPFQELRAGDAGTSSAQIAARVSEARARQSARGFYNSEIPVQILRKFCSLDEAGERTLELAVRKMGLNARAHDRLLKFARTIADLDHAERVSAKHLAEAVQYGRWIGLIGNESQGDSKCSLSPFHP